MDMRFVQRSVLVMLALPVLALAQTAPASKPATPATPTRPDFRLGKIDQVLTPEQQKAIMNPTPAAAAQPMQVSQTTQNELSDVVVRGTAPESKARLPVEAKPCGWVSLAWFLQNPAEGWRLLTPIPSGSEFETCANPPANTGFIPDPQL